MSWFLELLEWLAEVALLGESALIASSHPQVSLALWNASQYDLKGATRNKLFYSLSTSAFQKGFIFCKSKETGEIQHFLSINTLSYWSLNQDLSSKPHLKECSTDGRTSFVTRLYYILLLFLAWADATLVVFYAIAQLHSKLKWTLARGRKQTRRGDVNERLMTVQKTQKPEVCYAGEILGAVGSFRWLSAPPAIPFRCLVFRPIRWNRLCAQNIPLT